MQEGDSHTGTPIIQAVGRAVEVMRLFSVNEPHLSLGQITSRLGMSKASAHRYVTTLRQVGLLAHSTAGGYYTLAPQMLAFASVASAGLPIVKTAEPFIAALVKQVDETVVLSVLDGDEPVVVRANSNTLRDVKVDVRVGMRLNRHWSAQGQVFWAFTNGSTQIPADMDPQRAALFRRQIEAVQATSVAIHSNATWGIRTLAVPVLMGEQLVASLAIVGTMATVPDGYDSDIVTALQAMVGRLMDVAGGEFDAA